MTTICAIFLGGCISPEKSKQKVITRGVLEQEDLVIAMFDAKCVPSEGLHISDHTYKLPTKEWLENDFGAILKNRFLGQGWIDQSYDCDDFVLAAHERASYLNRNDGKGGVAIGEFYYVRDIDSRGHAVNCAIYLSNNIPAVLFIEPQTGDVIKLSVNEIESCVHWRF